MKDYIKKERIKVFSTEFEKDTQVAWYNAVVTFIIIEHKFLLKEGINKELIALAKGRKPFSKKRFLDFLLIVFHNKKTYKAFKKTLSTELRFILNHLALNESILAKYLLESKKITVAELIKERGYYGNTYFNLLPDYKLFNIKGSIYHHSSTKKPSPRFSLFIPPNIRKFLIHFYKIPNEAQIKPLKKIENTDYLYEGQTNILQELPKILAYNEIYTIKLTNSGKLLKTGLTKLKKQLDLSDFFPESDIPQLNQIRMMLVTHLIGNLSMTIKSYEPLSELKNLFNNTFVNRYDPVRGVLFFLNTTTYTKYCHLPDINQDFFNMLKNFPCDKWIGIKNIENHIKHFNYETKPITEASARDQVYFSVKTPNRFGGYRSDRSYLDSRKLYKNKLIDPTVKGMLFLFAAFGLIDIAYNKPKTDKEGELTGSFYEGLTAVRLNKLGNYVLGNTDVYEDADQSDLKLPILSDNSLTIICDKEDDISPLLLPLFAKKVSSNRFKLDPQTFLAKIKTKKELDEKVARFKKAVRTSLPDNWKLFFKDLENKMNPLAKITGASIFKIPKENAELLNLIARNENIQSLCLKAEDHHVIVLRKNIPQFKSELLKYGYFI